MWKSGAGGEAYLQTATAAAERRRSRDKTHGSAPYFHGGESFPVKTQIPKVPFRLKDDVKKKKKQTDEKG